MTIDLDIIRQAIEERDAARMECDLLAQEMVYKGNSVGWWHSKAERYKNDIGMAWDALKEVGIRPDGETHIADAIRKLAARK